MGQRPDLLGVDQLFKHVGPLLEQKVNFQLELGRLLAGETGLQGLGLGQVLDQAAPHLADPGVTNRAL